MVGRLQKLRARDYAGWIGQNLEGLAAAARLLTPRNRALLKEFTAWRGADPRSRELPRSLGIYPQTRVGDAILQMLAQSGHV